MPAQSEAANLLVLTSQAAEAERITNALRGGGLAVRGMFSAQADRIADLVKRHGCDLIVCCAYDPDLDLARVLARHGELGADLPLIVVADLQRDPEMRLQAMHGGARDVTERDDTTHLQRVVERELADLEQRRLARTLAERLEQCEQRNRELVTSAGDAVAFVQDGLHVHANPAFLGMFRFPGLDELQGATFLDLIDAERRTLIRDFLRRLDDPASSTPAEIRVACVRADASRFDARLIAAPAEIEGERCLRIIVRDGSAESEGAVPDAPAGAGASAPADGLARLVAAIDGRSRARPGSARPFAVYYVRALAARGLLDERGLAGGREAIGAIGPALERLVGERGLVERVSDEGFGILLEDADEVQAEALAERIRVEVRLPQGVGTGGGAEPDCAVGLTLVAGADAPATELFDRAYRSSRAAAGRSERSGEAARGATSLAARVKQPEPEPEDDEAATRAKVEYALEKDRLILVYQPIVSLMGDNQENYSVLVRLIDEEENLLEAGDFIGAAIRNGLIERVDKWAIREAIKAIGEHRRAGHNLNFFINLAEDTFRDPATVIWICDCLREFDVRGSWLTLVFQEELVARNLADLNKLIDGLRKIKCRVAVNRFGATEHPEGLLQGIALDFVLLLPEFAQGLADDKDKQQRLLTLANLTREYNVKSVVTGVEDARALTILWTAGVDYVQGNFLQRPSPTLELAT